MGKYALILVSVFCASAAMSAELGSYDLQTSSLDFAAPVVGSKTSLSDVAAGQIVFEQGTGFWGLTTAGGAGTASNWIQLSSVVGAQVISPAASSQIIASASIDASGTVSNETGDWINGNCSMTGTNSATATCAFVTGVFSAAPNCVATIIGNANAAEIGMDVTGSQFVTQTFNTGAGPTALGYNIICMGQ